MIKKSLGIYVIICIVIFSLFSPSFFSRIKYELKNTQPFLYYVYRRRIENANVRILFVCLLAGLSETDIKKRLRSV